MGRRRIRHTKTFKDRLIDEAAKCREASERLSPGTERELLMKRMRQIERAVQISDWLATPNQVPAPSLEGVLKTS
jgi:hypothetical protein